MRKPKYFVAHEFSAQAREDLRGAIERGFRGTGFQAYYADNEVRQGYILEKIRKMILTTQFGIYDITNNEKPNVFLELGLAMSADRPRYIICMEGAKIPADLQGIDRLEYQSYKNLTEVIKKKIVKEEVNRFQEIEESLNQEFYEEISEKEVREKCWKLYQAEELEHRFGNEVEDKAALTKKAWFANLSELRGHIIYGPYEVLPEIGNYIAFFKIKIDDNSSIDPIILLDVTGGGFASSIIRGIHFHEPDKYQLFGIKFNCRVISPMEYRVFNQIQWKGKVWIDYVAIVKAS